MNMALDWFPEAAWKGTAVLAVLFLVARTVGRDAAARHLVWTLGLAVVLAMPLLTELLPWRLPIRPAVLVETTPAIPSDWRPDRDKHQPKPEAPETISRNRAVSRSGIGQVNFVKTALNAFKKLPDVSLFILGNQSQANARTIHAAGLPSLWVDSRLRGGSRVVG